MIKEDILTVKQVLEEIAKCVNPISRSTLYRMIREDNFIRPTYLNKITPVWSAKEVKKFIKKELKSTLERREKVANSKKTGRPRSKD